MQNAGQQYGQGGGVSSHQTTTNSNFSHTEPSSITSSLRQFRRKPEDKHPPQELNRQPQQVIPDSHVARVAPHSHYPSASRPSDCYRYPPQYPEYSVPSQVKYSEISEPHQPIQEHVPPSPSVIQKAKGKDYMDMCGMQQSHVMKQPYPEHMGPQQPYADHNVLPQSQYVPKEAQIHSLYKQQESQFFPKDQQFPGQLPHQMPKYNVAPSQLHKDFLSQLQKIHPTMARAIMNDHQMKEPPRSYQNMEQNRMYNQPRYVNHPTSPIQANIYPHGYGPPPPPPPQAPYSNYPSSCSYTRAQQMPPRFPPINPHERSISPRRNYSDGMNMPMNYPGIPQKISPNYPQYNSSEYPQHFQQRRSSMSQEYYQQHCRPTQYIPHQLPTQDLPDPGRVTVSDNIKQYIENWADEETATEMNQIENNRLCKENVRAKEGQPNETIYAINASDLQYLEPIVATENGIPVVTSENGQYILKSGVSLDNSSGMIRLVDKNDLGEPQGERVVNLQIMESPKPDCMLAGAKPTPDPIHCNDEPGPCDKSRIVIHQNTVIQSSVAKEKDVAHEQVSLEEELNQTIIRAHKRETMDKNCSPINLEQTLNDDDTQHKVMYPSKKVVEDINCKNMPIIENMSEQAEDLSKSEKNKSEAQLTQRDITPFEEPTKVELSTSPDTNEEKESKEPPPPPPSSPPAPPSTNEEPIEPRAVEVEQLEVPQISPHDKENPSSSDQLETNENPSESTTVFEENKHNNNLESLDLSMKYDAQEESKPKRARRFFSVDDIINNIGSSVIKSSRESEERRHSIHTTAEFLNREIHNTFVQDIYKSDRTKISENEIEDNTNKPDGCEENVPSDEKVDNADVVMQAANETIVDSESSEKSVFAEVANVLDHITTEIEDTNDNDTEETNDTTETIPEVTKDHDETVTDKISKQPKNSPAPGQEQDKAGQEVQYRNIIRVDETNVLLHIAGELVEVNVHTVNGKKMITVVPLSSSTVADLNDNYEMLDGNEATTDRDGDGNGAHVDYNDGSKPELASEVIIGMDLSLEEEIQLDLEQPQVICTKAAKKAYDCDLQIPSITTSEDVYEDSDTQLSNIVSSSKEKAVAESEQSKTPTVSEIKTVIVPEDDEFVPFKDLIKARKLRKMRMKASQNEIKADSTNKIDEVVNSIKKEQSPTTEQVPVHKPKIDDKQEPEGAKSAEPTKRVSFSEPTDGHSTASAAPSKEPARKSPTTHRVVAGRKSSSSSRVATACKEPEYKSTTSIRTSHVSKDSERKSVIASEHTGSTSSKEPERKSATLIQLSPASKDSERKGVTGSEHKSAALIQTSPASKDSERKGVTGSEHKSAALIQTSPGSKDSERKGVTGSEHKSATSFRASTACKESEQKSATFNQTSSASKDAERKRITALEYKSATLSRVASACKEPEHKTAILTKTSFASKDLERESVIASEHKSHTSIKITSCCKELEHKSVTASEHNSATSTRVAGSLFKQPEQKSAIMSHHKSSTTPTQQPAANRPSEKTEARKKLSLEEYNRRKRKGVESRAVEEKGPPPKKSRDDMHVTASSAPAKIRSHRVKSLDESRYRAEMDSMKRSFDGTLKVDEERPRNLLDRCKDEMLQIYKEQVESKLSSLNIQIPRVVKCANNNQVLSQPFPAPKATGLMERFLRNEHLTPEEMQKVRKIVSCKRLVQQLKKGRSTVPLHYEVNKEPEDRETKLHLKKLPEKKARKRFRNLYGDSSTETDSDDSKNQGDYSVVQSNCLAGVVPKLIIKRKPEASMPFVKLERLDMELLARKKYAD